MTIINVCNLFAPIVGPLIGIINILILYLSNLVKDKGTCLSLLVKYDTYSRK